MADTQNPVKNFKCVFKMCGGCEFHTVAALVEHYCHHPRKALAYALVKLQRIQDEVAQ